MAERMGNELSGHRFAIGYAGGIANRTYGTLKLFDTLTFRYQIFHRTPKQRDFLVRTIPTYVHSLSVKTNPSNGASELTTHSVIDIIKRVMENQHS